MNQTNYIRNNYYHREYTNDIGSPSKASSWSEQTNLERFQRVACVALPFISLHKSISFPLSLGMGGLRTINSLSSLASAIKQGEAKEIAYQLLQTTIAGIAVAGTIFAHPLGMIITTGQDLLIDLTKLAQQVHQGDYKKAGETCLSILNNSLYMALFLHGGLEISIASLGAQIILGIYRAQEEFREGRYLEGAGHVGMALIRGNQMAQQVKILQFKWKLEQLAKESIENKITPISENETITAEQLFVAKFKALIATENFNPQKFNALICNNSHFKDQKLNFDGRLATPLEYACHARNPGAIIQMIDAGWCVATDQINMVMSRFFHGEIVKHLINKKIIDSNATVTSQTAKEITLLGLSLQYGDNSLTKFLLENKADPNLKCYEGYLPLHVATLFSRPVSSAGIPGLVIHPLSDTAIQTLLDHGADFQKADCEKSLLELALCSANPHYVSNLVSLGANVNAKNDNFNGRSVLQLAAARGYWYIAERRLVDNGAELEYRDDNGNSALHYAARSPLENYITIDRLKDLGLKLDDTNNKGETPLYLAALEGNFYNVQKLVLAGADIDTKPSPLEIAIKNKRNKIAEYLISCLPN